MSILAVCIIHKANLWFSSVFIVIQSYNTRWRCRCHIITSFQAMWVGSLPSLAWSHGYTAINICCFITLCDAFSQFSLCILIPIWSDCFLAISVRYHHHSLFLVILCCLLTVWRYLIHVVIRGLSRVLSFYEIIRWVLIIILVSSSLHGANLRSLLWYLKTSKPNASPYAQFMVGINWLVLPQEPAESTPSERWKVVLGVKESW